MSYVLRDYQQKASDAAVKFFKDRKANYNAIMVLPTGAGKSLIIADIASRLDGNTLVFQPSKEILQQNYQKLCSYGILDCSVYSASFNSKEISRITFATIGSVKSNPDLFKGFNNVIVDECHGVNPKQGMYKDFFDIIKCKVLGLTASPYRLKSYRALGSFLQILTRCRGAIFKKIIYSVQISTLLDMGYLAKLKYYSLKAPDFNLDNLKLNTTKADYTDKSVQKEYERIDFYSWIVSIVKRLINPCKGRKPHGILVFTRFVKEAKMLAQSIPSCEYVSGETPKKERERIIEGFKDGTIKVVANAGVLICGFDYPALDTVVLACPTMSLARYYQEVGRAIRPYPNKEGWVIDCCGTFEKFGKVEDLVLHDSSGRGKWDIYSNGTRLTSRFFE